MRGQMRFFIPWFTVLLLVFSSLTLALAAEEVSHPYLESPEYKNGISEIHALQGKIDADKAEIDGLSKQIRQMDLGFYRLFFSFFSFLGVDLSLIGLVISTILIIIYLRYLKKYNPLKWFILFKSRRNAALVLNTIRRISKGIPPVLILVHLLQAGPALGDGLKSAQLSMSQDPLEKVLNLLSCGESQGVIDTGLDDVKGLPFYRQVKSGSYQHLYDVLALHHALKIPLQQEKFTKLLSECPRGELAKAYILILSIDDTVMVKQILQQRLMSLIMGSGRSDLDRVQEIVLIYAKSRELSKLELIKNDLLSVCDASLLPRSKFSLVYLADMALDLDLDTFKGLWSAIKNEFPEFAKERDTRMVFQDLLTKASAIPGLGPLYDTQEFLKLIPFLDNNQKVQVALLFSIPVPDLAKSVVEMTSFDSLQFKDMNDAFEFSGVVKNLVPAKVPDLVKRLGEMVVHVGLVPFKQIRELFQPLSMGDDSIIDALVQTDRTINMDNPGKSKWITAELLQAASSESRQTHFVFLKERYGAYKNILAGLHAVDMDLFYQYLDFMYTSHGSDLMSLKFSNNLYSFTAWRQEPVPLLSDGITVLPWNIFLLHYEAAKVSPDAGKLHELLHPIDSVLSKYSCNNTVVKSNFPDFLVYYQITKDSKDPALQQYNQTLALILEKEIKERWEAVRTDISKKLQPLEAERGRLRDRLTKEKREKTKALIRFIALAILLFVQAIYILVSLGFSLKYAFHLLIGRTSQRVALFLMVFLETLAKFLLPTLILLPWAVVVIVTVQAFALLCGREFGFPTITEAVATYNKLTKAPKEPREQAA